MGRREKSVSVGGDPSRTLGDTLRRARQTRGLSLTALADALGYTKGHVSSVETGAVWPSREFLTAYERAVGLADGSLVQVANGVDAPRRGRRLAGMNGSGVGHLLSSAQQGLGSSLSGGEEHDEPRQPARHPVDEPVIRGADRLLLRGAELVEEAALKPAPPGGEIIFTFRGPRDAFSVAPGQWRRWRRALRAALVQGWDVVELCPFDGDEAKQFAMVDEMLQLLGFAGHYRPLALPRPEPSGPAIDFTIVPGVGALVFLATRPEQLLDAAFFYADDEHLEVLREHVELLRAQATAVLKLYRRPSQQPEPRTPHLDLFRMDQARSRAALQPGGRFLVKDALGTSLLPHAVFQERARAMVQERGAEWAGWTRTLAESRVQQVAAFHQQVRTWPYRDLYTRQSIERLVAGGDCFVDDWLQEIPVPGPAESSELLRIPASPLDRVREVQAVVDLLRAYPNYEVALLDDDAASEVAQCFWEVKGSESDSVLFLDTWYPQGDRRVEVNLEITQRVIVDAFRAYFLSVWERLPAASRSKEDVIAWLQAQIDRVQERVAVG